MGYRGASVGERVENDVRVLRETQGWTQQELAERAGVSRQSIISIERGRYVPSLALALRLARLFGRASDDVFWLEEEGR
jgi:putative transcriptional regulator